MKELQKGLEMADSDGGKDIQGLRHLYKNGFKCQSI